jgi:hypothetical protein
MKIEKGREVDKKEAFFSGKKINSNIFKKKKDNKQKKKKRRTTQTGQNHSPH